MKIKLFLLLSCYSFVLCATDHASKNHDEALSDAAAATKGQSNCQTGGTGIVGYYPAVNQAGQIELKPLTEQEYFQILCAANK